MPIVNTLVTREGTAPGANRTTADQKAAVYEGIAIYCSTSWAKLVKIRP